ncbi:sialidase family protein [Posidoniimonas polymericola]|nr:sialidase family protein [Posidoniimonas polymericola]
MSISQIVDVSAFAALIDAGDKYLDLSFAYNAADPSDYGVVSIGFLDEIGGALGFGVTFNTSSKPTASASWANHSLYGQVPSTTRLIQFTLAGERTTGGVGSARNVNFDSLTAQLLDELPPLPSRDVVHGDLVQFNSNGAWSWYQDERAIVDQSRGELLVGSIANRGGLGGEVADGQVQTSHFDLATRTRSIVTHNDLESYGAGDDHNVPAYLQKQDGDILAFYAPHNNRNGVEDDRSYYRTFNAGSETWGPESEYHWWPEIPSNAPGSGGTTYSNVFQLSAEDTDGDGNGRLYNIARTQQSPHIMYSDNNGSTWQYGGQLTEQPEAKPAGGNYVNGYYKYWSNGVDRIDFIATEYHPRDFNTSIYHAYIQGGKMYDSLGNEIDADIFDAAGSFDASLVPSTDDFTPVFSANGVNQSRAWNTDVMRYPDGTIATLFKTREAPYDNNANVDTDDHRVWYGRFDPTTQQWTTTEIAKAGARLFGSEQDYTGLGALDPSDPTTIFISSPINPSDDTETDHHEIYKGVTGDNGLTWNWSAVTENSSVDNLRPIIPQWDEENTALLWWRGSMSSSQNYDAAVVGLLLNGNEALGDIHYVDATAGNTTLTSGRTLTMTSGSGAGAIDDLWHVRTGVGNGGDVFTADEVGGEEVPTIQTSVEGLDAGVYDVFAYFWVGDSEDWRVVAGLSQDDLSVYRMRGSQQVEESRFEGEVLASEVDRRMYQAYLGRASVADGGSIAAFIDDYSTSGSGRVWYDGLGYALVTEPLLGDFNNDGVVDAADYSVWRDNLGASITLPNEDPSVTPGTVSEQDYETWRKNYGAVAAAPSTGGAREVPEPAAAWLLPGLAGRWWLSRPEK